MPSLVIRSWNGRQHHQIVHGPLTATIRNERNAGKAQAVEISAAEAALGIDRLVAERKRLAEGDSYHGA